MLFINVLIFFCVSIAFSLFILYIIFQYLIQLLNKVNIFANYIIKLKLLINYLHLFQIDTFFTIVKSYFNKIKISADIELDNLQMK